MANVSNAVPSTGFADLTKQSNNTFYAVYDCCITNNPSWDFAFIEQRLGQRSTYEHVQSDEKYFQSLSEAKNYVNGHFASGAEYFSLEQSAEPDNILQAIIDKITYLMA
jgi:hypothetical protein